MNASRVHGSFANRGGSFAGRGGSMAGRGGSFARGGGGSFPFFLPGEGGAPPQRRSVAVTNPLTYL